MPGWSASRSPCSRGRGATSIRPGGARPTCRSAIATPGGAAQGALDLAGDGGTADGGKLLPGQIPLKKAIATLKPLLEDPAVLKVGQNIKYDMCVFRRYGVEIGPVDDTMLISFVLDAGKNNHGMDELAELHLGQKTIKFSDVAGSGAKQVSFDKVPIDKARDYAAEDADVTMQLWARLKPRLVPEHMVDDVRDHRAAADPGAARHGDRPASRSMRRSSRASAPISRSAWASSRARSTRSPAASSTSARPSSWARSCSTSRSCRAASATRTARGRPTPRCSTTSPRRAIRCRSRSWSIASSPSSRAPTPTRWCASSMPRPAACTPRIT